MMDANIFQHETHKIMLEVMETYANNILLFAEVQETFVLQIMQ